MELGLAGKVAAITGGSEGIGFATALRLAEEGVRVAICARRRELLEEAAARIRAEAGGEVLAVPADVTRQEDCERFVGEAVARFGRLDILVNNAGTSAAAPFEEVDEAAWSHDLDLKLRHAVRCSRAAIPHLRAAGGGAIVNVLAVLGKVPAASSLPTSVSRAAGLALTKAMSKDLGRYNIRVNAVCIGLVRSGQIERRWRRTAPDLTWEEFSRQEGRDIPLGRIGEADEAARAIVFLASPAASYITGTALNVDGGRAAVL
ncbi:MAG: SDR family oxidoreductase [Clostridia bacterium]|nr:SDR family oxidoreductase [Clostridia bacterium]